MALLTARSGAPQIDPRLLERYAKINKASWADLYFDLYREVHNEDAADAEIMADAEARLEALRLYREAVLRGDAAGAEIYSCFLCGGTMGAHHQCLTKKGKKYE